MNAAAPLTAVSAVLLCVLLVMPPVSADQPESVSFSDSYHLIASPDVPVPAWIDVMITGPSEVAGGSNSTYDVAFTLRYDLPMQSLELLSASWYLGRHEPDESDPNKSYFKADAGILTLSGVSSGPVRTAIISVSPERWPHWDSAGDAHIWFYLSWRGVMEENGILFSIGLRPVGHATE